VRILWVEDQFEENKAFLRAAENAYGASVEWAGSVAEAYRKMEDGDRYDVIVVDLKIPLGDDDAVAHLSDTDFNGQYVIIRLEEQSYVSEGKVICLTNFVVDATSILREKPVRIVRKAGYLREFVEAIGYASNATTP
jgi:CheY-like chemotaxis protein